MIELVEVSRSQLVNFLHNSYESECSMQNCQNFVEKDTNKNGMFHRIWCQCYKNLSKNKFDNWPNILALLEVSVLLNRVESVCSTTQNRVNWWSFVNVQMLCTFWDLDYSIAIKFFLEPRIFYCPTKFATLMINIHTCTHYTFASKPFDKTNEVKILHAILLYKHVWTHLMDFITALQQQHTNEQTINQTNSKKKMNSSVTELLVLNENIIRTC